MPTMIFNQEDLEHALRTIKASLDADNDYTYIDPDSILPYGLGICSRLNGQCRIRTWSELGYRLDLRFSEFLKDDSNTKSPLAVGASVIATTSASRKYVGRVVYVFRANLLPNPEIIRVYYGGNPPPNVFRPSKVERLVIVVDSIVIADTVRYPENSDYYIIVPSDQVVYRSTAVKL